MEAGLDLLLEAKAGSVQSLRIAWAKGWSDCLSVGMEPAEIALVAEHLREAVSLSRIARCLRTDNAGKQGEWLSDFLDRVDDSAYPLRDWLVSLELLMGHMAQERREVALARLIGYVACGAELAAATDAGRPLPQVIDDLYREHGVE